MWKLLVGRECTLLCNTLINHVEDPCSAIQVNLMVIFLSCNLFDQKAIDCRSSTRRCRSGMSKKRLYPLASLCGHIKCYMCHNFVHMAKDCKRSRSLRPLIQKQHTNENAQPRKQWRKRWKTEEEIERCGVSLCLRDEDEMWYIYSRSSHHILGHRRKFHFLKRTNTGCVVFEGNETTRVSGSGKAILGGEEDQCRWCVGHSRPKTKYFEHAKNGWWR